MRAHNFPRSRAGGACALLAWLLLPATAQAQCAAGGEMAGGTAAAGAVRRSMMGPGIAGGGGGTGGAMEMVQMARQAMQIRRQAMAMIMARREQLRQLAVRRWQAFLARQQAARLRAQAQLGNGPEATAGEPASGANARPMTLEERRRAVMAEQRRLQQERREQLRQRRAARRTRPSEPSSGKGA